MMLEADQLSSDHCNELATLHLRYLPESMVAMFGRRYALSFYRYVARSSSELLVFRQVKGRVTAACILSLSPQNFSFRLVIESSVLLWMPLAVCRNLARYLDRAASRPMSQARDAANAGEIHLRSRFARIPEVVYIFTDSGARGRGLGSGLLASCEEFLVKRGYDLYTVNTWDDDAHPTTRFYLQNGFVAGRRFVDRGTRMQTMGKALAARFAGISADTSPR